MDRQIKRTDYIGQVKPRQARGGAFAPDQNPPPKPLVDEGQMTISIRLNYPDFTRWRAYQFARQYPYLSIVLFIISLMFLVLAADGLTFLGRVLGRLA